MEISAQPASFKCTKHPEDNIDKISIKTGSVYCIRCTFDLDASTRKELLTFKQLSDTLQLQQSQIVRIPASSNQTFIKTIDEISAVVLNTSKKILDEKVKAVKHLQSLQDATVRAFEDTKLKISSHFEEKIIKLVQDFNNYKRKISVYFREESKRPFEDEESLLVVTNKCKTSQELERAIIQRFKETREYLLNQEENSQNTQEKVLKEMNTIREKLLNSESIIPKFSLNNITEEKLKLCNIITSTIKLIQEEAVPSEESSRSQIFELRWLQEHLNYGEGSFEEKCIDVSSKSKICNFMDGDSTHVLVLRDEKKNIYAYVKQGAKTETPLLFDLTNREQIKKTKQKIQNEKSSRALPGLVLAQNDEVFIAASIETSSLKQIKDIQLYNFVSKVVNKKALEEKKMISIQKLDLVPLNAIPVHLFSSSTPKKLEKENEMSFSSPVEEQSPPVKGSYKLMVQNLQYVKTKIQQEAPKKSPEIPVRSNSVFFTPDSKGGDKKTISINLFNPDEIRRFSVATPLNEVENPPSLYENAGRTFTEPDDCSPPSFSISQPSQQPKQIFNRSASVDKVVDPIKTFSKGIKIDLCEEDMTKDPNADSNKRMTPSFKFSHPGRMPSFGNYAHPESIVPAPREPSTHSNAQSAKKFLFKEETIKSMKFSMEVPKVCFDLLIQRPFKYITTTPLQKEYNLAKLLNKMKSKSVIIWVCDEIKAKGLNRYLEELKIDNSLHISSNTQEEREEILRGVADKKINIMITEQALSNKINICLFDLCVIYELPRIHLLNMDWMQSLAINKDTSTNMMILEEKDLEKLRTQGLLIKLEEFKE